MKKISIKFVATLICATMMLSNGYTQSYVTEITDPNNSNHPHKRQLNTGLEVGKIDGNFDVSPAGGAVYNMPLVLPEGINGMTPQLAITYNSHAGNGIMGMGWNLSGLSAITRTGRTIYHDGVSSPITLETGGANERLMLDGQRLISTSSTLGLEAAEYRTEHESFAKITKTGSNDSRYFTVKTKDGKTIEYGNTANSKTKTTGSGGETVIAWCINKMSDPYGNFIKYDYTQSSTTGEQYINKIEYGYNNVTSDVVVGKVEFVYQSRTDNWKSNVSSLSKEVAIKKLLQEVQIYENNSLVGKYKIGRASCRERV